MDYIKKPANTIKKKGNKIQPAFSEQIVDQVMSAAFRTERVEVTKEQGPELLKKAKVGLKCVCSQQELSHYWATLRTQSRGDQPNSYHQQR